MRAVELGYADLARGCDLRSNDSTVDGEIVSVESGHASTGRARAFHRHEAGSVHDEKGAVRPHDTCFRGSVISRNCGGAADAVPGNVDAGSSGDGDVGELGNGEDVVLAGLELDGLGRVAVPDRIVVNEGGVSVRGHESERGSTGKTVRSGLGVVGRTDRTAVDLDFSQCTEARKHGRIVRSRDQRMLSDRVRYEVEGIAGEVVAEVRGELASGLERPVPGADQRDGGVGERGVASVFERDVRECLNPVRVEGGLEAGERQRPVSRDANGRGDRTSGLINVVAVVPAIKLVSRDVVGSCDHDLMVALRIAGSVVCGGAGDSDRIVGRIEDDLRIAVDRGIGGSPHVGRDNAAVDPAFVVIADERSALHADTSIAVKIEGGLVRSSIGVARTPDAVLEGAAGDQHVGIAVTRNRVSDVGSVAERDDLREVAALDGDVDVFRGIRRTGDMFRSVGSAVVKASAVEPGGDVASPDFNGDAVEDHWIGGGIFSVQDNDFVRVDAHRLGHGLENRIDGRLRAVVAGRGHVDGTMDIAHIMFPSILGGGLASSRCLWFPDASSRPH